MEKKAKWLLSCVFLLGLFVFTQDPALADKPPWSGGPGSPKDYPEAPEPVTLTLIGMGASGAFGYYLGKRKRRRIDRDQRAEDRDQRTEAG